MHLGVFGLAAFKTCQHGLRAIPLPQQGEPVDRHSGDQSDAGEQTKQREHHAGQHGTRDRTVIIDGHDDPRRCDGKRPTTERDDPHHARGAQCEGQEQRRHRKHRHHGQQHQDADTENAGRRQACQTVAGRIIDTERTHGQRGEPGSIRSAVPGG